MTNTNMPGWGGPNTWHFNFTFSPPPPPPEPQGHVKEGPYYIVNVTLNGKLREVWVDADEFWSMVERADQRDQAREQAQQRRKEEQERIWRDAEEAFRKMGWANNKAQPKKPLSPLDRLGEIAGMQGDLEGNKKKVLRRAQRNAHPDTGGSHELWLEVEYLQRRLGL